jgi:hypothetical protein
MAILIRSNEPMSHWYRPTGESVHKVPTQAGGLRPTTIRDAIREKLLPSVTNILNVIAKPQLENWKLNQVAIAALKNPKQPGESDEYWIKRVVEASKAPTQEAADLGSRIHEALELATSGQPFDEALRVHVEPVIEWITKTGIKIVEREVVLVNPEEGYAGRCDALFRFGKAGMGVIDFKTRKTEARKAVTPYDGQGAQLAAYAAAYFGAAALPKCLLANVYISTTEPGRMEVCKHPDPAGEYEFFLHCAAAWRKVKQYDPRQREARAAA